MAAKKKSKKKSVKAVKASARKPKPARKLARATPRKSSAKKAAKGPAAKKKPARKSAAKSTVRKKSVKLIVAAKKPARKASPLDNVVSFQRESARVRSAGQSGGLQGLSDTEQSNSESVDELLEEGNTFEAEAVAGVEHAGDAEGEEVHTHEVPEDDVPSEYLDKD